jgi:hypothetical protein
VAPTAIAISPNNADAQSGDLTLTITGAGFGGTAHNRSQAIWSANGSRTALATTFLSSTKLTAVIPALLLQETLSARVFVETGDRAGDLPPVSSGAAEFDVFAPPVSGPLAISPTSATAGSADVSITLTGSGFLGHHFKRSQAIWAVGGTETTLATTFVSSQQLTAVIPAALLISPVVAQVFVLSGDMMDDVALLKSGPVTFSVTR